MNIQSPVLSNRSTVSFRRISVYSLINVQHDDKINANRPQRTAQTGVPIDASIVQTSSCDRDAYRYKTYKQPPT